MKVFVKREKIIEPRDRKDGKILLKTKGFSL